MILVSMGYKFVKKKSDMPFVFYIYIIYIKCINIYLKLTGRKKIKKKEKKERN